MSFIFALKTRYYYIYARVKWKTDLAAIGLHLWNSKKCPNTLRP